MHDARQTWLKTKDAIEFFEKCLGQPDNDYMYGTAHIRTWDTGIISVKVKEDPTEPQKTRVNDFYVGSNKKINNSLP